MSNGPILAIEAAVGGGSIAVVSDGEVLFKWTGNPGEPHSEELLLRISEAIDASKVLKNKFGLIAVSNGPGSYTGIRIGIATAMGLSDSLGIPVVGISLLKAIALSLAVEDCIVVVPAGRNGFCWQRFGSHSRSLASRLPTGGSIESLVEEIRSDPARIVACQSDAFERIVSHDELGGHSERIVDIGRDLAASIAFSSVSHDDGLEPFYIRDEFIQPKTAV